MGAILGLGMTHFPLLASRDENMSRILRRMLQDPGLPAHLRSPDGWPEPMRKEWSSDEGLGAAKRHREALVTESRQMRRTLDEFAPDFIGVWGDDQYENFKEDVISPHGSTLGLAHSPTEEQLDPPSPAPWRCFDLGRATARVMAGSPWRVALIASSSWSHAFLTYKHHLLYPDVPSDRALYEALRTGDWATWRQTPLSAIEDAGEQEMLNWMCLAGAMSELGRHPNESVFIESWIFNSNKVFATFKP